MLALKEPETKDLTWRELELKYDNFDLMEQLDWARTREILTVLINVNSKKKYRSKDIVKLDKIDTEVILTQEDKRRLKRKAKLWQTKN